jgi:ArsR family transcriptional regulator
MLRAKRERGDALALPESLESAVQVAKALGHPTRLRIVAMLERGPLCVCQLTAVLGAAASTISGHLLELRRAGVIREAKQGKWVEYRLSDDTSVRAVVAPLLVVAIHDRVLDHDRDLLRDVTSVPAAVLCQAGLDVTVALKTASRQALGPELRSTRSVVGVPARSRRRRSA